MTIETIRDLLQSRHSVFPKSYNSKPVATEIIQAMLENANTAPSHKLTFPWRFKVFGNKKSLEQLGIFMSDFYRQHTPTDVFSEERYRKMLENPRQASHIIAICIQRDERERVPEWEEVAAVAMAVQNMWLTASALGVGAYWSTPEAALSDAMNEFLHLPIGQRCLGLFYVGHYDMQPPLVERPAVQVEWK